jgi:hypothetical protein
LRGDAQLALLGALEKNADRVAEAQTGLKEHAERFDSALSGLEGMALSAASKDALATVHPLVRQYVAAVSNVVSLSATNAPAAQAAMPALQAVFSQLETQMAGLSETIAKNSEALDATANSRVRQAAVSISAALAFAVAVMTVAALSLARSMARPISRVVILYLTLSPLFPEPLPPAAAAAATAAACGCLPLRPRPTPQQLQTSDAHKVCVRHACQARGHGEVGRGLWQGQARGL